MNTTATIPTGDAPDSLGSAAIDSPAAWTPAVLTGPHTHVTWTPDSEPPESRKMVVVISNDDYKRACSLLQDKRDTPNGPAMTSGRYSALWDEVRYAVDQPGKFADVVDRVLATAHPATVAGKPGERPAVSQQQADDNQQDIDVMWNALQRAGLPGVWPNNMNHRINEGLYAVDSGRKQRATARLESGEAPASANAANAPVPDGDSKGCAPKRAVESLYQRALDCPHSITDKRIVLNYDSRKPGNNALDQLARRLRVPAQPGEDFQTALQEIRASVANASTPVLQGEALALIDALLRTLPQAPSAGETA